MNDIINSDIFIVDENRWANIIDHLNIISWTSKF